MTKTNTYKFDPKADESGFIEGFWKAIERSSTLDHWMPSDETKDYLHPWKWLETSQFWDESKTAFDNGEAFASEFIPTFEGHVQDWRDAFIEAFCGEIMSRVPEFDINEDGLTSTPWCCPWLWTDRGEYRIVDDPVKAGQVWAINCADEIAERIAEEQKEGM